MVTDEGYKIAEAPRIFDISANMLGRWVREARAGRFDLSRDPEFGIRRDLQAARVVQVGVRDPLTLG